MTADAEGALTARPVAADDAARVLARVRERAPLVHCMTNIVVAGFTANVLLAVGASPAMVDNAEEAAGFAEVADALLVNLGTLSPGREEAMRSGTAAASAAGTPWVLDPVAVGALAHRTALARDLLDARPAVVRGNASEVIGLAGAAGSLGRGVDSTADPASALAPARELAASRDLVVAVSGAVDRITDGEAVVEVATGHEWMTRVTGVGCALGALVAACCAVEDDGLVAASAATAVLTVAAQAAAARSAGPGTFAVQLLDAVHALDAADLREHLGAVA